MILRILLLAGSSVVLIAQPLPRGDTPPGKVLLVIHAHHDDHISQGGLIARFVDKGYEGYYVRVSNDEKDGSASYAINDMINLRECVAAAKILGLNHVVSLNWRNDYMDPTPHAELRDQLILLIRKYRPDAILSRDPWAHYDRNPDHRKVARAVAEAYWMAGYANYYPEHLELGLKPHRVPYLFYKARTDYGKGHDPNVVIELTEDQVRRRANAHQTHRNVFAKPANARSARKNLAANKLVVPELEGLDDQAAAVRMQEWQVEYDTRRVGRRYGIQYGEVHWFVDEFDYLPGFKNYIAANVKKR
jgi:LmbE family N-acetylglucosaminyl deacetylase